jgi:hypothetical protein
MFTRIPGWYERCLKPQSRGRREAAFGQIFGTWRKARAGEIRERA